MTKLPHTTKPADDYQTPASALLPLLPHLIEYGWRLNPPRKPIVWECAEGKGNLSQALRNEGLKVIGTDVLTGQDFLMWQPEEPWDCIVTNPPYSLKEAFLERCYLLGKPFALLLPVTTLEAPRRQTLLKDFGTEIIFFRKRVRFETPTGESSSPWFAVAWFTWGFNIGKELNFP